MAKNPKKLLMIVNWFHITKKIIKDHTCRHVDEMKHKTLGTKFLKIQHEVTWLTVVIEDPGSLVEIMLH